MVQQAPEAVAVKRIEAALRSGATSLNISGLGLRRLPTEIGGLTALTELHLQHNQLSSLPPEIGRLTALTELWLNNNQLSSLPPEIGSLTALTELWLYNNQLSSLPPEIGSLTALRVLALHSNQLSSLPPEIGSLTALTNLTFVNNQLSSLPPEIGSLTALTSLWLYDNQLSSLPPEIGNLRALTDLWLHGNQLSSLPAEIGSLPALTELDLENNQLSSLPAEIGSLPAPTELDLENNQLSSLPAEIGSLPALTELRLDDNPLITPDPTIVDQGTAAVLSFLRQQQRGGRRQWVSKLLLVGEGGVGKTSLLRSLKREPVDEQEETTHGIQIRALDIEHPAEAGVVMRLNAWDFGGQVIYHATHQFFLTDRSLFILVWDARHGHEQGRLPYWLETIQARAPDSPVLIVAAHVDERDADVPRAELMRQYPQVVGHFEVSNKDGRGIDTLREYIANTAAGLPLMGEMWPATWLDAADEVREVSSNSITPAKMSELIALHGVRDEDARVLAQSMHDLGEIMYFRDDDELNDTVILKPQWVSGYISEVLESKEVIEGDGIFRRQHMEDLWKDVGPGTRDHFLRLMERFDLSYRTLENSEISLVVERLPLDPADYEARWSAALAQPDYHEISMRFRLSTIPAGIPTWFIARSHRFTTRLHWRNGALFADSLEGRHVALVRASTYERHIDLTVRGPTPQNFFTLLKDGVEVTLERFPGLNIDRVMPCPGHNGDRCSHLFRYDQLLARIERKPPRLTIECPEYMEDVSVPGMLFGLAWATQDAVLERIDELEAASAARHGDLVTIAFRREQSRVESACPNVFVVMPSDSRRWPPRILSQAVDLQLYCNAPGEWHPTSEGGRYQIDRPGEWLAKAAPYLARLVTVLKYTAPLAGPWLGVTAPNFEATFKHQLALMKQLAARLPDLAEQPLHPAREGVDDPGEARRTVGASLRALRELLDQKDPQRQWGGLRKVLTPEHHYLWLCDYHASEYAR